MTSRAFPIALAAIALSAACASDNGLAPSRHDEIVGTWISTGSDVALGLSAAMRTAAVKATFSADSSYRIELIDSTHATVIFAGTWSVSGTPQSIRSITLTQIAPAAAVEQGVFQVNGARLTFEVVPIQSSNAPLTAATIAGGFGSTTSQDGAVSSQWIQRFWNADADLIAPPCNPDTSTVLGKRPCDREEWVSTGSKR
jgi:hypothetical protein